MSGIQKDRPYQVQAVQSIFVEFEKGIRSTLLVLPTGTGKTVCSGMVAERFKEESQGSKILFLAHREELIEQAANKISPFGLSVGIEMAAFNALADQKNMGSHYDVVVGSVQSMQRDRLAEWPQRHFGLIITDEAHHARARTYGHIYEHFNEARHLGITATPDRGDKKNLGAIFQSVAFNYKLRDAIKDKWIVPLETCLIYTDINLRSIRTTGGDYNQGDLEDAISPHIEWLADAVRQKIGSRQGVAFTPDVGSAEAFADAINQMGIPARAVSGKMPKKQRKEVLLQLRHQDIQLVACADLLVEGWDEPCVSCVANIRVTKKRNRYAQQAGRGTRPWDDWSRKSNCLIIDFDWDQDPEEKALRIDSIDLFDDSEADQEVLNVAKALMKECGYTEPMAAVEEAEKIVKEKADETERIIKDQLRIKLRGKIAEFKSYTFDPVGVGKILGIPISKGWDYNKSNPATDKQIAYLKRMGIESPEGLSKTGAGKAIGVLRKREESPIPMATPKQVGLAITLGVPKKEARQMTFDEAWSSITEKCQEAGI